MKHFAIFLLWIPCIYSSTQNQLFYTVFLSTSFPTSWNLYQNTVTLSSLLTCNHNVNYNTLQSGLGIGLYFVHYKIGGTIHTGPFTRDHSHYTLRVFLTQKDCDVTERAQGYMLQDASYMRQSRCSFLNAWENTQVACTMTSVFLRNTRWRHGRSRGETKYIHLSASKTIYATVRICYCKVHHAQLTRMQIVHLRWHKLLHKDENEPHNVSQFDNEQSIYRSKVKFKKNAAIQLKLIRCFIFLSKYSLITNIW